MAHRTLGKNQQEAKAWLPALFSTHFWVYGPGLEDTRPLEFATCGDCPRGTHSKADRQQPGKVRLGVKMCSWQGTAEKKSGVGRATGRERLCQARSMGFILRDLGSQ